MSKQKWTANPVGWPIWIPNFEIWCRPQFPPWSLEHHIEILHYFENQIQTWQNQQFNMRNHIQTQKFNISTTKTKFKSENANC